MSRWLRKISSKQREELLDKLHRGFVDVCLGVSLITSTMVCYKVYEYFRYIRPYHRIMKERGENELLSIGQPIEINESEEMQQ